MVNFTKSTTVLSIFSHSLSMSHLTCLGAPRTLGDDTILGAKSLIAKPFVSALVSAICYKKDWFLYQVLQSIQLIS